MATRIGTVENDTLAGTDGNDVFFGGDGDDDLFGLGGNDVFDGGDGNDALFGGDGEDVFYASLGNDTYIGGDGFDTLSFARNERFVTVNIVSDNSAFPSLTDGKTYESVEAVIGTDFDDVLTNYDGTVAGVYGGAGRDRIDAWINGLDARDRLFGGAQADVLEGRGGNDRLFGGGDADVLDGGAGRDKLRGGFGADTLFGGDGIDKLKGGRGADVLDGGTDDDVLRGKIGRDTLDGGLGNDLLVGGIGRDVFVIDAAGGDDIVRDFAPRSAQVGKGRGDQLLISQIQFGAAPLEDIVETLRLDANDTGAGILLDFGLEGSLLLKGVTLSDMNADWFTYF